VPKHAQKMKNKSGAQEIRFFGKIGFLKPPKVPKKSDFFGKIGFLKRAQGAQEILSVYPRHPLYLPEP
jgi:ribosomal protein L3